MTSISVTSLRKDIYNVIARANADCAPVAITNSRGKGAVLVGEDDWAAIEETLYLVDIPGMAESLLVCRAEPLDECVGVDALDW